ncbi:MAG: hypothetical protein GXP32_10440, partial [Kiritimatiellaeota bacterium]|nr:hypothetical protein [Kiritimatiellota bacterium]
MRHDGKSFEKELRRFRRERLLGELLRELARCAGIAATTLLVYVYLDYALSFENEILKTLNYLFSAIVILFFIVRVTRVSRISLVETAKLLDSMENGREKSFQAAFELHRSMAQRKSEMGCFLADKVVEKAGGEIMKVKRWRIFPKLQLKRQMLALAAQTTLALALILVPWRFTSVVLDRIFHPDADIPPYSELSFAVIPETPTVIYGGNIELKTVISGDVGRIPVLLKTKLSKRVNSVSCFKSEKGVFSQRIEKLTEPVQFCFTAGRARSRWVKITLLTRPRFSRVGVSIKPPSYVHRAPSEFQLNSGGIKVLKGSAVYLEIASNRPLSSGRLSIVGKFGKTAVVEGVKINPTTLAFSWKAISDVSCSIAIKDIRGTPSKHPLKFKQTIIPDHEPEIAITEPDSFVLATPNSNFDLKGYAEDDFALKRVALVRTVTGYRDRMKFIGPKTAGRRFSFTANFDLEKLGVSPGETLEIYAEAADFNPTLKGVSISDVVRVKIISEEEYAEMLRTRTRVATIFKRHNVMRKAFRELQGELDSLIRRLRVGKPDAKEIGDR